MYFIRKYLKGKMVQRKCLCLAILILSLSDYKEYDSLNGMKYEGLVSSISYVSRIFLSFSLIIFSDMAVQNVIGDSFRGATWVAIHNGGGVGWGEVINGGFGLVLDGSTEAAERAEMMLGWDVSNGVSQTRFVW